VQPGREEALRSMYTSSGQVYTSLGPVITPKKISLRDFRDPDTSPPIYNTFGLSIHTLTLPSLHFTLTVQPEYTSSSINLISLLHSPCLQYTSQSLTQLTPCVQLNQSHMVATLPLVCLTTSIHTHTSAETTPPHCPSALLQSLSTLSQSSTSQIHHSSHLSTPHTHSHSPS
jgi:hypothetical protein